MRDILTIVHAFKRDLLDARIGFIHRCADILRYADDVQHATACRDNPSVLFRRPRVEHQCSRCFGILDPLDCLSLFIIAILS